MKTLSQNSPISVILHKQHPSQKLGISLLDDFDGTVRIVKLVPNSVSCQSELQLYDKLLSINGQYILGNANEAIQILKDCNVGDVTIVVTRDWDDGLGMEIAFPSLEKPTQDNKNEGMAQDAPPWSELSDLLNQSVKSFSDGQIFDLDQEEWNRTLSRSSTITTSNNK